MKSSWFALMASAGLAVGGACVQAGELSWLTDYSKAQAQAQAEGKRVLINFTGTDWCPYCVKLEKQVLVSEEFASYARKHLVLVLADFPKKKAQTEAQKKANEALKKQFAEPFQGYPTLVMVDAHGKKLGEEVGYDGGGPKVVIAALEKMR